MKYRKKNLPIPPAVWKNPLYFIAFGFGSGASPIAPGTVGTIVAIPFYLLLSQLSLTGYLFAVVAVIITSAWLCEHISKETHTHDHPGMNIDEFAGFFVTMIHAPHGWKWIILGFVFFRIFDIVKPWPINKIDENIHGGVGMVLDDVVAGIFSMVLIQILAALL